MAVHSAANCNHPCTGPSKKSGRGDQGQVFGLSEGCNPRADAVSRLEREKIPPGVIFFFFFLQLGNCNKKLPICIY